MRASASTDACMRLHAQPVATPPHLTRARARMPTCAAQRWWYLRISSSVSSAPSSCSQILACRSRSHAGNTTAATSSAEAEEGVTQQPPKPLAACMAVTYPTPPPTFPAPRGRQQ